MKNHFSLFASFCLLASALHAQDGEGYGFLNFVNMIPGDKTCEIRIGAKNPAGDGLKVAEDTGWFLHPVGSVTLAITMEGLEDARGSLAIKENTGSLVAIYLETATKPAKDGKPAPPLLRIKSLPTYEAKGLALRFVSLCPANNRFQLGPQRIEVKPFEVTEIPGWTGAAFEIRKDGKDVAKIAAMREKEAFYLLTACDPDGNHTAALVYGGTVKVPPWRQRKKPENPEEKP